MKTVNATHSGYVTMILKDGKYHVTVSSATNTTTYILDESFVATCSFVTAGAALGKVITNEPVSTNTVYAVHGGNVTVVQTGDTWQVTVTHENGTQTVYSDLNQVFVTSCSTVNEGDPIGSVDVVHVPDVSLVGVKSISGGGDLTEDREFEFVNDEEEPGANKYYGTDSEGVRHWLPNIEPEVYTVNNGLTQEPGTNNFQLGGDLIKHTHLTQNFNLSVTDGTMSIGNAMNVSGARLHVEKDTSGVGIYSIKRGHIHSETGISVLGTRVVTTGGTWAGSVLAVGVYGELGFQGSGDFSFTGPKYVSFAGVNGVVTMYDGTGNLTSGISMYSGGAYYLNVATSNDVDNFAAIRAMFPIQTPGAEAFTGTVTNYYGLYIDPLNYTLFDITNRYAIYQAGTTDLNYYAGDIRFAKYPSTRNDGATLSALYVDASGNLKHGPIDVDMGGATENGGYFIWNQSAVDQAASFRIDGTGQALHLTLKGSNTGTNHERVYFNTSSYYVGRNVGNTSLFYRSVAGHRFYDDVAGADNFVFGAISSNFHIGNTTSAGASYKLQVTGNAIFSSGDGAQLTLANTKTASDNALLRFKGNSTYLDSQGFFIRQAPTGDVVFDNKVNTTNSFAWHYLSDERMMLNKFGVLKISSLAGTGNRFVQADASGVLSATATIENGGSYIWNQNAVRQVGAKFWLGNDTSNSFNYTGTTLFLFSNSTSAAFEIQKASIGISNMMLLTQTAGDGGYMALRGVASAGFLPAIYMKPGTTFGRAMWVVETLDTITEPAIRFDARKLSGPLLTQPIFSVGSYSSEYLRLLASGQLLVNNTVATGTYKFQVTGGIYATARSFMYDSAANTAISGTVPGTLHLQQISTATNVASLTFGGHGAGFNLGQAGIYVQTMNDGTYMYLNTTNSFIAGSQNRIKIDPTGIVTIYNLNDTTGIARMVVTTDGILSYQNIPSGGGGSVTSVDASVTAATALSVTGGPITTSGTLAFSWTGANTQWVMGDGSLVTMPNSGNYIYNQNASSQTANYWINGLGRIDTALRINSSSTAYRFIVDNDHTASGYRVTGLVANAGSLTASLPLVGLYGAVGLTGGAATIGGNATANAGIYGVFAFKGSGTQTLNTVRGIYTSVMGHLQLGQSAGDVISGTGTAGFPSSFATWNTYYGTANIDRVAGFIINDPRQEAGLAAYTGTITNYYGIYIRNIGDSDILARITNRYAIFQSGSGDLNVFNGQIYAGNVPIYTTGDRQVLVRNVATGRLEYSDISFGRFGHVGEDVLATADRSFSVGAYQLTINSTGTTASSVFSVVRSGTSGNAISGTGTTSAPIIKANQGGGGSALWGSNSNNGIGVEGLSVGNTAVRGLRSTSGTNDFINVMEVMRGTTGTAANGIGGYINFQIVCNTTVQYSPAGHIGMKWTDATYATRTAAYEIWITNNAVTAKKFGIAGNGDTVVEEGDLEVKVNTKGLILQSPDGTRYRVTAANGGTLSIAAV